MSDLFRSFKGNGGKEHHPADRKAVSSWRSWVQRDPPSSSSDATAPPSAENDRRPKSAEPSIFFDATEGDKELDGVPIDKLWERQRRNSVRASRRLKGRAILYTERNSTVAQPAVQPNDDGQEGSPILRRTRSTLHQISLSAQSLVDWLVEVRKLIPTHVAVWCIRLLLAFLMVAGSLRFLVHIAIPYLKTSATLLACETVPFSGFLMAECAGNSTHAPEPPKLADIVHKFGEVSAKSADYAELLVKTNLPPAVSLSLSKLALEDLTIAVEFSDLSYKDVLGRNLQELVELTDQLFVKVSELGASARSTVDILFNYINIVLKTVENPKIVYNHDKLREQYDMLIGNIDKQISALHQDAAEASNSLRDVREKLKAIDKVIHAERKVQQNQEEEALPYLWSSVFKYKEREKFKKNFELLNSLEENVRSAKASVAQIIGHLVDFRNDLTQLKISTGRAQWAMELSLELHVQILKTSLDRLKKSKQEITEKRQNNGSARIAASRSEQGPLSLG